MEEFEKKPNKENEIDSYLNKQLSDRRDARRMADGIKEGVRYNLFDYLDKWLEQFSPQVQITILSKREVGARLDKKHLTITLKFCAPDAKEIEEIESEFAKLSPFQVSESEIPADVFRGKFVVTTIPPKQ